MYIYIYKMYDRIRNPETNRYVSIYTSLGKKIIQNYIDIQNE